MDWIDVLRWLHVIGATVLLGTGAGIAFFMLMAHRTGDPKLVAHVAGTVVIADTVFTATAAVVQPITGIWLACLKGWPMLSGWLALSICFYVLIGLFWLPVVWIQVRMRDLARAAAHAGCELPREYFSLFRIWFACGIPAFLLVLALVWLMLVRPPLSFGTG